MSPYPTLDDEAGVNCENTKKDGFTHSTTAAVVSGEETDVVDDCRIAESHELNELNERIGMDEREIMSMDRLFCPLSSRRGTCEKWPSPITGIKRNQGQQIFYTDVVVVGNGPSALALSSFFAGYRPYYEGTIKHPDPWLHEKLDKSKSLLEQDLHQLCEGLEGRSSHQVSLLYDYLVRPEADYGHENASTLTWRRREENTVPHVILGQGAVGGTWADLTPEVMTLSFASWLDLPAYSFRQWLDRDGANFATDLQMKIDATKLIVGRVPCEAVRRYYRDYVKALNLDENVFEYSLVTSVRKRRLNGPNADPDHDQDSDYEWDVSGCYSGGTFHFRSRRVILATGVNVPKRLGIPAEDNQLVLHSTTELDRCISELISQQKHGHHRKRDGKRTLDPVLIIGDGLSAADAVIKCLINGIAVVHSFRKTPKDPKQVLSKLSSVLYPEYHTVFQLMTGDTKDPLYTVYARTQVQRFEFTGSECGSAVLRNLKNGGVQSVRFNRVVVLIGFQADLSFLNADSDSDGDQKSTTHLCQHPGRAVDSKTNTLNVDPITCRCVNEPNLYAVGPLIGDNFVRYVIGGSMASAADILKRY